MRLVGFRGTVIAGVALVLFTLVSLSGRAVTVAEAPPSELAIDEATQFRETFGLRSDRAFVIAASTDSKSFPDVNWGVPLSAAEAADLANRRTMRDRARATLDYASKQSDYGGAYLDQLNGGIPTVLFTGNPMSHQDSIQQLQEIPVAVRPHHIYFKWKGIRFAAWVGGATTSACRQRRAARFGLSTQPRKVAHRTPTPA